VALALIVAPPAWAASAPFDLSGPQLQVSVTRDGQTLPISETPNLAEGDSLSIRADLPKGQSVHYLLVAGFLRGAINPPPADWFFQSQTWNPKAKAGLALVVPKGAQQLLVFLAPATGGDFQTLVNTVRARPGAFVRASQDLNQASLDHARLEAFMASIRKINDTDPTRLKAASPLLARSLAIKLDVACLTKTADTQASCLTQGQDSLVLNDGHSTSMVQALSSGYSAELIQQLSATPQAGGGYFSPYIASVLDMAHILDSFHTAQYQYIPAIVTQAGDRLSLLLNSPPSFQNPKSVLVVALPAVEPAQPPPLHAIDPNAATCLQKPGLLLPVEGAPLVFSTAYAHDLALRLKAQDGTTVDLPVTADAELGGLVVKAEKLDPSRFGAAIEGSLQGRWGFEAYAGPRFRLDNARPQTWRVKEGDEQALTAGRDGLIHIQADAVGCVQGVSLQTASDKPRATPWTAAGPQSLSIKASLKDDPPGPASLLVRSYGGQAPDVVPITIYAPASRLERFTFHAGDRSGVLKGADLGKVASLSLAGVNFSPDPMAGDSVGDTLTLQAGDADAVQKLKAGQGGKAIVKLKDGRSESLSSVVANPRPSIALIAKSVQPAAADGRIKVELGGADELPHDAKLTFSLRAQGPTMFSGSETVEVATVQGGFSTTLTAANGGFTLQNTSIALGSLDLGRAFGSSAFGPLRFRLVNADGDSDWLPLGVLVRLPTLHELNCPAAKDQACQLSGSGLFLISAISNDPGFEHPIEVPLGFPGDTLQVPHPADGRLYLKLGDDPSSINTMAISEPRLQSPTVLHVQTDSP
jgi:hypothetical protein